MSEKTTAIVVTHSTPIFGPPHALANSLKLRSTRLIYIDHPLQYDPTRHSRMAIWENGHLKATKTFPNWGHWTPLNYLKDIFATIWFLLPLRGQTFDYYIGCDNLSCLPAIWLRRFFHFRALIAYNVDYSPSRFLSPLLDRLYRWADRFTTKHADYIWCVTQRIAQVRIEMGREPNHVLVVPNGVNQQLVKKSGKHNKGLVYVGNLVKEKGVDQLIKALGSVPRSRLTIMGDGPEQLRLQRLMRRLGLDSRVTFSGRKKNEEVLAALSDYTIGVALYAAEETYVYYCDPLKVKEYLAAGLPVIMTGIPEIADAVAQEKAGVVVTSPKELPAAIKTVIEHLDEYRANAIKLAAQYDWQKIFDQAFSESPLPDQSATGQSKKG